MRLRTLATIASLLAVVFPIGSAQAATRHAATNGSGISCSEASPCSLSTAAEFGAPGDTVIVHAGTYNATQHPFNVAAGVTVTSAPGEARPLLTSSVYTVLVISADATVRDLTIEETGTAEAVEGPTSGSPGAVIERLFVHSSGRNACFIDGATLRDSVCWSTADNGNAVLVSSATSRTTTLRNVTAIQSGTGSTAVGVHARLGAQVSVSAKNVIADGSNVDVLAGADDTSGASAAVTLGYSDFDTIEEDYAASVTQPGTTTNQITPPEFVAPDTGNFHETATSPTVDAGTSDTSLGAGDLDDDARTIGSAPDIGADEYVPPPAVGDNSGGSNSGNVGATTTETTTEGASGGTTALQATTPALAPASLAAPVVDTMPPRLLITVAPRQKARGTVKIVASCPDEACKVRLVSSIVTTHRGRTTRILLGSRSADLIAGVQHAFKLVLSTKARKAIASKRTTKVVFVLVAADGAGNQTKIQKAGKLTS